MATAVGNPAKAGLRLALSETTQALDHVREACRLTLLSGVSSPALSKLFVTMTDGLEVITVALEDTQSRKGRAA
jgi:hypothetical protein